MAEFACLLPKKKAKLDIPSLDNGNRCIFCVKPFTEKRSAVTPEIDKLETLFSACRLRQDEISEIVLSNKDAIINHEKTFHYHRDCRATYCSKQHIHRKLKQTIASDAVKDESDLCRYFVKTQPFRRSQVSNTTFAWRRNCFICGKQCFECHRYTSGINNWSLVATVIGGSSINLYTQMLEAATTMEDTEMIQRLHGAGADLVAVEARYHRKKNCLSKYLSGAIKYSSTKDSTTQVDKYKEVISELIKEYTIPIIQERQVFLLSTLRDRFHVLAVNFEIGDPDAYTSQHMKTLLSKMWPDVAFISQTGMSDFVCSRDVTIGDAFAKVSELQKHQERTECCSDCASSEKLAVNEDSIVHNAIGIIRRTIMNVHHDNSEYFSSQEMTVTALKHFVDPLLYKALAWLTDEELYRSGNHPDDDVKFRKCLNIGCDIVTLATSVMSPKHLGLSVHLYHDFGSRKLIDGMYDLGYGISYTELRTFLTSAAIYSCSSQKLDSGCIIPAELKPKSAGGKQIIMVADNWDHNECTVDGKNTTHAMTSIIVTQKAEQVEYLRIPRLPHRTYDISTLPGGQLDRVIPYRKPPQRMEPCLTPPPSVDEVRSDMQSEIVVNARLDELLYNMMRSIVYLTGKEPIRPSPPWGPFHIASTYDKSPVSAVAYNPIIMAAPTDMTTIYTVLKRNKEIGNSLGHTYIPAFFDMGLLTKALEVTWSRPQELSGIIPCEGGMHLLMSVMTGIGHLYGDAGLRHLLQDSDVFASGTVQRILSGKDFSRGIYAFKLIDEVLHYQFYKNFEVWCKQRGHMMPPGVCEELDAFQEKIAETNEYDISVADGMMNVRSTLETGVLPLLQQYRDEGRQTSPTFKLWDEYLNRVSVPLMMFLRASRHGNWQAYQSAKIEFLPLLFASGRTVYARYMPLMILMMNRLPSEILKCFQEDKQFVTKLTNNPFNMVWPDYVLETTQNKSLKGTGGIIGLTLRGAALARWFLVRPISGRYSSSFQDFVLHKSNPHIPQHHSNSKSEIQRWNRNIKRMKHLFEQSFLDPFSLCDPPGSLINFATGTMATPEIEVSIIGALDYGVSQVEKFVEERLIPDSSTGKPQKSFYKTLPRSTVKTMTEMARSVKTEKRKFHMNADVVYLRLLAINAKKQVSQKRLMSFENAPVPLSMFLEDGTMFSGSKCEYMHKLEDLIPGDSITSLPNVDTIIWDGHAVIQMMSGVKGPTRISFADMASRFGNHILNPNTCRATQIHVIFDRYLDNSTKTHTRAKRSHGKHAGIVHILPEADIPRDWTSFLSRGENKAALAKYFTEYLMKNAEAMLSEEQVIYISGGMDETAMRIDKSGNEEVDMLKANHEEADTRIILHAMAAVDNGANTIVVSSPDTDVLVLLLHHFPTIKVKSLFFLTGNIGKRRYIPVHLIHGLLSSDQLSIILSVYCLTGCDTVSSFYGHGKKTAFRLIQNKANRFQSLSSLGLSQHVSEEQRLSCTRFVSALYGKECDSLNDLRCIKAEMNISGRKLPPTDDSFRLHVLRCCYQLMMWRQAIVCQQILPDPTGYGYEKNSENLLCPILMNSTISAPELLNNLVCNCQDFCEDRCTCVQHNQPCTLACTCGSMIQDDTICENPFSINVTLTDSDDDTDNTM